MWNKIFKNNEFSSKKVYEGLNHLTNKHLKIAERKEQLKDDLNLLAFKKIKTAVRDYRNGAKDHGSKIL